jgi:hypothetical protein
VAKKRSRVFWIFGILVFGARRFSEFTKTFLSSSKESSVGKTDDAKSHDSALLARAHFATRRREVGAERLGTARSTSSDGNRAARAREGGTQPRRLRADKKTETSSPSTFESTKKRPAPHPSDEFVRASHRYLLLDTERIP